MAAKVIVIIPAQKSVVYDAFDGNVTEYLEHNLGKGFKYACGWSSGDTMYIPAEADSEPYEVLGGDGPYKGIGIIIGREIGDDETGKVIVKDVAHTLSNLKIKFSQKDAR